MNKKTLGTLCMVGGAAYLIVGIKFLINRAPSNDLIDLILSTVWSFGGICGILGMLAEQATGENRIVRGLSYLPIVAFLLNIAGNVVQGLNPALQVNPLTFIALLLLAIGMLLVGSFTVFAKVWKGGRQFVPFLPALMPFVGMAIGSLIGIVGGVNVSLVAISWIVLGFVVFSYGEAFKSSPVTSVSD